MLIVKMLQFYHGLFRINYKKQNTCITIIIRINTFDHSHIIGSKKEVFVCMNSLLYGSSSLPYKNSFNSIFNSEKEHAILNFSNVIRI